MTTGVNGVKEYLGDGVYVESNLIDSGIVLTTSNGLQDTNTIYLEVSVLNALILFITRNSAKGVQRND